MFTTVAYEGEFGLKVSAKEREKRGKKSQLKRSSEESVEERILFG